MHLVDTHCHLDVAEFDVDREVVLQTCHDAGINKIVVPAIEASSWLDLLRLCGQHDILHPALGLHPVYIDHHNESHLGMLDEQLADPAIIAVGEIGLDFYIKALDRDRQIYFFEAQLQIAKAHDLPVLLHVRKSHDQVLSLLKKHRIRGGIAHAFNGSEQQAQQYIDLGFKLGFGGTMTYAGSKKIHQLAKTLPLESIVLETDAPDMVVEQHRGERNSPAYLLHCLSSLAELRDLPVEDVALQTTRNACEILNLN